MSHECMAPSWNRRHQRQEQVEGEERKRSSHVHTHLLQNPSSLAVPLPGHGIAELTWENGQLAMHGLGLLTNGPTKPTWDRAGDTLEAIVNQAAAATCCHKQNVGAPPHRHDPNPSSTAGSSAGKQGETSENVRVASGFMKKRMRSEYPSACASASASASASTTICKDNDTSMMTWTSFESPPPSLKAKTIDEDSACHDGSENVDEEQETKGETARSHSTKRSRAAAVHNQSERRRRDRINQKMKALQKLVPNASKIDKASMLDEVIEYLKQLQAQVQMMSSARNMPQMMMPLGMQQHIQMSLLARMGMGVGLGMGMGMGMLDMSSVTTTTTPPHSLPPVLHPGSLPAATPPTPSFLPPHFMVPPMVPNHTQAQPNANAAAAINNSYALLAQSMNMDLYSKMAVMYRQQLNQPTQPTSNPAPPSHAQGG